MPRPHRLRGAGGSGDEKKKGNAILHFLLAEERSGGNGEDFEQGHALDIKFQNLINIVSSCEKYLLRFRDT